MSRIPAPNTPLEPPVTSSTLPVRHGQRSRLRRLFPIHGLLALIIVFLAGSGTRAHVAANKDLNGDGRVDAVFTQKQRYNQVCFGTGTGAFTSCRDIIGNGQFTLSNQLNTTASALVDWDNDQDLDIVLALEGHTNVVCYNDGAGDFNNDLGCVDIDTMPYNTEGLAVGDLDGDGAPDVVFANGGNAGLPLNQPNVACYGFNTGASVCQEFGTNAPSTGVALADLNSDGRLDVIVSNRGTQNEVCLNGGRSGNSIAFDCRAIPQASTVSATKVSNAVAVGNLAPGAGSTPDTLVDVVFANDGKNEVCYGTGNWAGTNVGLNCIGLNPVSVTTTFTDANARTLGVAVADFMPFSFTPGDEIVWVNVDSFNVRCWTSFTCVNAFQPNDANGAPTVEASMGVAIVDINIDGRKDVVIANDPTSRSYLQAYAGGNTDVVANGTLHPTSVTLSGGTVGPPAADTVPPQIFNASNKTAEATGPGGAAVTFSPAVTATDLVDGAVPVTCTPASGSTFAIGTTTVSCSAKDAANNTGTASFTVTVRDTTGPAITVPANMTLTAPVGQASLAVTFSVSAIDLVDGVLTPFCYVPETGTQVSSGSTFNGGTWTVNCSAYDSRHNYGERTFTVTVITDIDNDGITDDIDTDDDGDGIADTVDTEPTTASNAYRFDDAVNGTVTRNGWTVSMTPAAAPAPGQPTYAMHASLSGSGTGAAVITATCGGSSKELRLDTANESVDWRCDGFSLSVRFISGTPEFWKRTCSGGLCAWVKITPTGTPSVAKAGSPVTADPSNTDPISVTIYDDNLVPIGSFTLDPQESVDVSVVPGPNNEPYLQLTVLNGGTDGNVTVQLLGQTLNLQSGAGPQTYDMHPDNTAPVVSSQVSGTLGNNGFYTSNVTVTWTVSEPDSTVTSTGCETQTVATDTNGVTFTCEASSKGGTTTQSVTIKRDATAPTISVPANITLAATSNAGAVATYTASALDALDPSVTATCAPASGSTFAIGQTTVTCTATDGAGNAATPATFTVTVEDTTAPTIDAHAAVTAQATSAAGASVTFSAPATHDVVDGTGVATCTPASGSTFPIGSSTVTCSATDAHGNAATPTTFTVTVEDTTAPTIDAHAAVTAQATSAAGATVSYSAPATHDAVDGNGVATCTPASGSTFAVGATTVTCTATDAHGNVATPVTFTVTVAAPPASTPGHMKGEGSVRSNNKRYEFKFDVREDARGEQGNLKLTVKSEAKGRERDREDEFIARTVSSVTFSDDPTDRPGRAKRPQVDTVLFSGVGSWNGAAGYSYEVFAQDAGEPGRHRESIRITIRNSSGAIVASVDGVLTEGNVQSFRIKH